MRIAISLFFLLSFRLFSQTTYVQNDKQLLWEISSPKLKEKSYIFGTIHSNDKRVFDLADSVYIMIDKAKMIVLKQMFFPFLTK